MKAYAIPKSLAGSQKNSIVLMIEHIMVEDVFDEIHMVTYDGFVEGEYQWTVRGVEKDANE